jgi:hypothetical protein
VILRLANIVETAIAPALALLGGRADTPEARVMLLASGMQESGMQYRRQLGDGPARSLWQFELGTRKSRGGVTGVFMHSASSEPLRLLCRERGCEFDPRSIWQTIEQDDVLAAGLARLLLLTDAKPLPKVGDADGGWACYLRNWRPGKPRPSTWTKCYAAAIAEVVQ